MTAFTFLLAALVSATTLWLLLQLRRVFGSAHLQRLANFDRSRCEAPDKLVVCFGDSITQGSVSFDWVDELARRLKLEDFTILNAGVNGQLAYNLLARIESVLRIDPATVVLVVGTNDARAEESSAAAASYVRQQRLPQRPDEAFFREHYAKLLARLAETSRARLILATLPMLGEREGEPVDAIIERMNAFIESEAESRGLLCLPLHHALRESLTESEGSSPPTYSAQGSLRLVMTSVARRYLLGWGWDRIAERNGMRMLTDMIHLSERGGCRLADLVEAALRSEDGGHPKGGI